MLHKTLSLSEAELKFADGGDLSTAWQFSGYASKFDGIDSYGDTILPGAYKKVLGLMKKKSAPTPKLFVNHMSYEIPPGKWLALAEDDQGLMGTAELTKDNPQAAILRAAMKHETIDGLSIGFRMSEGDYKLLDANPEDGSDPSPRRIIRSISELVEISVVTFPADAGARVDITSVKFATAGFKYLSEYEDYLRDACGLSKSAATAIVAGIRSANIRRESGEGVVLPPEIAAVIARNREAALAL